MVDGSSRGPARPGLRPGALVLLSLLAAYAWGDIYRYVDRDGVVHFTDKPVHSGFRIYLRTPPAAQTPVRSTPARQVIPGQHTASTPRSRKAKDFDPLVVEAAARWGVNPALVHAVITAESNYDPEALSHAGAMGLMQLMPQTARRFGVDDPWDPSQNVHGGTRYLRELLDRFRSLRLALAAYNAGEGAVEQHGNAVPPYQETQHYVEKVLGLFFKSVTRDG
jgi:soluble lytic murein transglycosylase-like protein